MESPCSWVGRLNISHYCKDVSYAQINLYRSYNMIPTMVFCLFVCLFVFTKTNKLILKLMEITKQQKLRQSLNRKELKDL